MSTSKRGGGTSGQTVAASPNSTTAGSKSGGTPTAPTNRPQVYTRKISVNFVEEAAQQLEGELLAQANNRPDDVTSAPEAWEAWGDQTRSNNGNGYTSAIRRISHHIQQENRSRRISSAGLTDEQEELMKRRSRSRSQGPIFIPHIIAYKGDVSKLKDLITNQLDGDTSFLHHLYDYTPGKSLLTKEEEDDEFYIPPPQLPKLIRAALKIQNVNNMTRDQRWLLQHAFQQSSLLHYACAADHYDMVSFLIDNGHDVNLLNAAGKPSEYYTQSDDIRELLWSKENESHNNNTPNSKMNRRGSSSGGNNGVSNNGVGGNTGVPPTKQQRKVSQHSEKLQQSIRASMIEQEEKAERQYQRQNAIGGTNTNESAKHRPNYVMSNSDPKMLQILKDTAPIVSSSRPLPKAPVVPVTRSSLDDELDRISISSDMTGVSQISTQSQSRRLSARRMSRVLNARRYSDTSQCSNNGNGMGGGSVVPFASGSKERPPPVPQGPPPVPQYGPPPVPQYGPPPVPQYGPPPVPQYGPPPVPVEPPPPVPHEQRVSPERGIRDSMIDGEDDDDGELVSPNIPITAHKKLSVIEMHRSRRGSVNQPVKPTTALSRLQQLQERKEKQRIESDRLMKTSLSPNGRKSLNLDEFEVDAENNNDGPETDDVPLSTSIRQSYHQPPSFHVDDSPFPPLPTSPPPPVSGSSVKFIEPPNDPDAIEVLIPVTSTRPIVTRRLSVNNTNGDNKLQSVTLIEKQSGEIEIMKEPKKALTPSARRASISAMKKQQLLQAAMGSGDLSGKNSGKNGGKNGGKMNVRRSLLFGKKVYNEQGERIMTTRKNKYGNYIPPSKDVQEERQRNRMKDFLSNFIPLEEVAGKVLAENSHSNQSSFHSNENNFLAGLGAGAGGIGGTDGSGVAAGAGSPGKTVDPRSFHIELYNKVANDERYHTFSAARSATTLSLIYENMDILHQQPKKVDPTSVSYREMLWRKAGNRMNEGLYDGPTMRLKKLRQEAYEDGLKELKREFRSYADRDDWEAVELLQQDGVKALDSLRYYGDDDLYLEESSLQQD